MQHLFASRFTIERPATTNVNGRVRMDWSPVATAIPGRIDVHFVAPGDIQPAIVAGKAPDRSGRLYCAATAPLKAGDRIVTESGPISGVFEIRSIPDPAVGYSSAHHIEVQIWETNRDLDNLWPGEG